MIRTLKCTLLAVAVLVGLTPGTALAIYGGEEASTPYSFMASMQFKNGNQHWCGGTLIAPQWVVTAKHCLLYTPGAQRPVEPADLQLRIGSLDRTTGGELVDVVELVVHGEPIKPNPTDPQDISGTDIALLKLARPVSLAPARIATSLATSDVRLLGWGRNCADPRGNGCGELPVKLRQLDTRTLPKKGCVSTKPGDRSIEDKEICQAATPRGENATAHDSGSPMLVRDGDKWQLVGATSGPVQQGADRKVDSPNVYTDVMAYRSWIASHVR